MKTIRVGLIGNRKVIFIAATPDQDYHLLSFANPAEKRLMPNHLRQTPWGYDSYRIYLPVMVIEKDIEKSIPGIKFKEVKGEDVT